MPNSVRHLIQAVQWSAVARALFELAAALAIVSVLVAWTIAAMPAAVGPATVCMIFATALSGGILWAVLRRIVS